MREQNHRIQPGSVRTDLNDVFSFDGIEPRILIVVQMTGRAALLATRVLHDEEIAAAVSRLQI